MKTLHRLTSRLTGVPIVLALVVMAGAPLAAQDKSAPVRVGGAVKPPVKIKDSKPVYPEDARRAKVQGVVITEATIGTDGKVTEVKVLRPLSMQSLNDAAVKAVKEQVYKPTLVDGVAVSVITSVPVFFTLD